MVQHLSDQVQAFAAPRQPRADCPPEIMKPHIVKPRRHPNAVPGPFYVLQMANTTLPRKHIGIPIYPWQAPERGDERMGHRQEMRAPSLSLGAPPFGPGQTH